MKCRKRGQRVKQAIKTIQHYAPNSLTLTNIKALVAVRTKLSGSCKGLGCMLRTPYWYEFNCSAAEKVAWALRVVNYSGKVSENIDYLTIRYNSRDYAIAYLRKKGDRVRGSNNPGYQHGGRLSAWSKKSKHYNKDSHKKAIAAARKNPNCAIHTVKLEHYIKQGMTADDAKAALSERQRTFSLDTCIAKYGKEEGERLWQERQDRWQSTLKSKPQEEMNDINRRKDCRSVSFFVNKYGEVEGIKQYETYLRNACMANLSELESVIMRNIRKGGVEAKEQLVLTDIPSNTGYAYDIYLGNKIIEVNGDYWHANPKVYNEKYYNAKWGKFAFEVWEHDKKKNDFAINMGYDVLVVWEQEYNKDRNEVISKCINFLTT